MNFHCLKIIYLNLSFYILFLISSAVIIPLLTLFVAFSSLFISHRQTMKLYRRSISFYGRVVTRLPFPLIRFSYEACPENNGSGPYIFVCNHRSACDPFLMSCLPYECIQVVNTWPFRLPVLGINAKWAGYLNIKMMPLETFFQKSLDLLKDGVSIIFFPEGTRSPNKKTGSFHSAAFRLSLESKVPIVPLCLSGNELTPPKGTLLLRPAIVKARTLPAIPYEKVKELSPYLFKNMVREIIEKEADIIDQMNQTNGFYPI